MQLEKWYADVVDGGRVSIHYRASLSLGPLELAYRGELGRKRRHGTYSAGSAKSLPRIEGSPGSSRLLLMTNGGALAWRDAVSRPICLWRDEQHRVTWNPLVLNGAVEGAANGRGYAEQLRMTVAPWRLAIDRLWWGRFCGDHHSLVWITWEGRHPLRLALFDGSAASLDDVTEEVVRVAPTARLHLRERRLLVDETLGTGALSNMPWPKRIAPAVFLRGRERKWLAEGDLHVDGKSIDHGAVVCETVDWS
jgi:hypothetical protein